MCGVAPRAQDIIWAAQMAQRGTRLLQEAEPQRITRLPNWGCAQHHNVEERPLRHVDTPVHVQFAEARFRIEHKQQRGCPVIKAKSELIAGAVAKPESVPGGRLDFERSRLDQSSKKSLQQFSHGLCPSS